MIQFETKNLRITIHIAFKSFTYIFYIFSIQKSKQGEWHTDHVIYFLFSCEKEEILTKQGNWFNSEYLTLSVTCKSKHGTRFDINKITVKIYMAFKSSTYIFCLFYTDHEKRRVPHKLQNTFFHFFKKKTSECENWI